MDFRFQKVPENVQRCFSSFEARGKLKPLFEWFQIFGYGWKSFLCYHDIQKTQLDLPRNSCIKTRQKDERNWQFAHDHPKLSNLLLGPGFPLKISNIQPLLKPQKYSIRAVPTGKNEFRLSAKVNLPFWNPFKLFQNSAFRWWQSREVLLPIRAP